MSGGPRDPLPVAEVPSTRGRFSPTRAAFNLLRSLVTGERRQSARLYTLIDQGLFLGERTRYLNLGWWDGATSNFDDASEALAEQLALAAGVREGDTVLDVGFGFADQDELWLRRFRPARIVGLNVTPLHVEEARRRFPDPRLDFRLGSATAMDLPDAGVDRVVALECAFHFVTREAFFREAIRVLRPGGTLATADLLPAPGRHGLGARAFSTATRAFFQVPRENWYGIDEYARLLDAAGFGEVEVRSVRGQVLVPFARAFARLVRSPSAARRFGAAVRWSGRLLRPGAVDALDYVLASARKPAA